MVNKRMPIRRIDPISKRPYPLRLKSKRRPEMTIAAGFKLNDGLLICADTKITSDYQSDESKIFFRKSETNGSVVVVAIAGAVDYAKACATKVQEAVGGIALDEISLTSAQQAVEAVLTD